LWAPAPAQESQQFYKKPETATELWRYMNHEIELGHFKLADDYLKGFIAKNPSDDELLQIQERDGNSAFARLLTIPELQADAKPLVDRVNEVLQRHLSDPGRLSKLIRNLSASPEEREYSEMQLRRSGPAAVPALMQALMSSQNNLVQHTAILDALTNLGKNAVPPLYAALAVPDPTTREELIETFRRKADTGSIPFLWYYSASPGQPELVRQRAQETLAILLGVSTAKLPAAKDALTQVAEKYYQHQVPVEDPAGIKVWRWEGKQLVSQTLTGSQAEEFYGLQAARQALELDPTYLPAQVVFLSLALEKGFERAGLDQPLSKGAPAVKDLLDSVNPQLIITVLNRALDEHRLPVILAATRGLGDLAEVSAVKPSAGAGAPVIVRAMYYPDRRVQLAAADSLLRIPAAPAPSAAARAVEIFRRAIAGDEMPKVLVADMNEDRANAVAAAVKKAGYEPVIVRTGREALHRLTEAADIDALLIDAGTPDPGLTYLLGQLRADVNVGLLPVIVTAPADRVESLQRFVANYRNVWVMAATADAEALKQIFATRIADAIGKPLSEMERKEGAGMAMEWLVRMSRGEVHGYDIGPAYSAILHAMRNKDLTGLATEAASRMPGREAQSALAGVVLDPNQPVTLRTGAAGELTRHIQQYGLQLSANEIKGLQDNFAAADNPRLKTNFAGVLGSMHPSPRQTGERLQRFVPSFAAPTPTPEQAPQPEPKEKKEDAGTGTDG
jgi:CheY-like chemotaxis protein